MGRFLVCLTLVLTMPGGLLAEKVVEDSSPLAEKAEFFQRDLLDKHWLDGLYVSIVPSTPAGMTLSHTVDEPGNVIHAGVWTGRYLAGVGYQYAVTKKPWVREHGGQILVALRRLQEVTGKPGLLARGYVMGHGPVMDWERDGRDSVEWHQGQGEYSGYRWYGDVSVDNFNAVLYGYAVYYDLAADDQQKEIISYDVERLMTHLLQNHCRIVDVDGEVTRWGHVGISPDSSRDEYYKKVYGTYRRGLGDDGVAKAPLRASLMLLPDLLIAHHITGQQKYLDFYHRVVARYKDNPEWAPRRREGVSGRARLPRMDHSPEGQAYEALYNLIRYEGDPELLAIYRRWVADLWDRNWMEDNSLFTYMTLALLPEYEPVSQPGIPRDVPAELPHATEGLKRANATLALFPIDRVLRPVMNSLRSDIEQLPSEESGGRALSLRPLPINQRPHDNEYGWKGNPYQLDGWLKPTVKAMQFACDDPRVAWFCDATGRIFVTFDRGEQWQDMTSGLMGARVRNIVASGQRTFVLWASTDKGVFITRDGGMSWREALPKEVPGFSKQEFSRPVEFAGELIFRIDETGRLMRSADSGRTFEPAMQGWRIPRARSILNTPYGLVASGPGGCYRTTDGEHWEEMKLWREDETGAADYLHAYWMGRYYGYVPE